MTSREQLQKLMDEFGGKSRVYLVIMTLETRKEMARYFPKRYSA